MASDTKAGAGQGMKEFFQSELFILLMVGVFMLIGWRIVKRGRMPGETPSVVERILMFGGFVITLTALLILVFRADVLDKPGKGKDDSEEPKELSDFEREPSGCSKPSKQLKEFKNQ